MSVLSDPAQIGGCDSRSPQCCFDSAPENVRDEALDVDELRERAALMRASLSRGYTLLVPASRFLLFLPARCPKKQNKNTLPGWSCSSSAAPACSYSCVQFCLKSLSTNISCVLIWILDCVTAKSRRKMPDWFR